MPLRSPAVCAALFASFSLAPVAGAQDGSAASPRERPGIGLAGGLGVPGPVGIVRISVPLGSRFGFDVDGGSVAGAAGLFGTQLRYLWRGRSPRGTGGYFLVGSQVTRVSSRTEIRWPDGRVDVYVTRRTTGIPQFGYGWDRVSKHGTRVGVELSTGGTERAGPRMFAKVFAMWGPG